MLFHYPAPEGDFAISDHLCLRLSYLVSMTARALVCLTWTVLTFFFSFFLFLLECVAAPSVKRTLFSSALREHTNVACFSTTLFNPLPPPWTVQRADRWHFIFVFWIRFTTRESIRFLCSFSLTRAPTQKTGKTKMLRPKPKAQVKSRLKPIYFSDDCFLYMLFMLSAAINIGLVCIDFDLFSQAFTPPSPSH